MSGVSSIFNEIITNNNFKNEFLSFWNKTAGTLHNDFMPTEVVLNSTDIALIKPDVSTLKSDVATLKSGATTTNGAVATNTADIATLKPKVATLEASMAGLSTVSADVATAKSDIVDLKAVDVSTLATLATLATDVSGLQAYDWSAHAATQDVALGNHAISGVSSLTCGTLNYTTLNPAIPSPVAFANTYYVDKAGSNSNAGTVDKPFLTIQKAIDVCEAKFNGTAQEIRVNFGSYVEQLTFKKPRIQLTAVGSRYVNVSCNITGNILVQVAGSTDLFNSQICLIGFQIVGKILDTSTSVHTLVVKDCYLYGVDNLISQTSTADSRTYLEGCTIQSSNATATDALLNFASGGISLVSVSITQKSVQSCLVLSGLAYFNNCALSTFTNDNSGAQLEPLVKITTAVYAVPKILANCGFVFSSLTAKPIVSGAKWNTAIWITGTNSAVSLINNSFFLYGTTDGANVVESPTGNFALSYYGNSSASTNAYKMAYGLCGTLNVSKFAMFPVS